jgi:hypothetical protein
MLGIPVWGSVVMAELAKQPGKHQLMESALGRMREALDLLDQAEAPADVGGHLDLAISRLARIVEPDTGGS